MHFCAFIFTFSLKAPATYDRERYDPDRAVSFFGIGNQVEHTKLNQVTAELPPG